MLSATSAPVAGVLPALGAVVVGAVAGPVVVVLAALQEVRRVLVAVGEEGVILLGAPAEGRGHVVALRVASVDRIAPATLVVAAHDNHSPFCLGSIERLLNHKVIIKSALFDKRNI